MRYLCTEPLHELADALERDRTVPLPWLIEYAPAGDIARPWVESHAPEDLLAVGALAVSAPVLVRCACALVREFVAPWKDAEPAMVGMADAAEGWADSRRSLDDVNHALDEVIEWRKMLGMHHGADAFVIIAMDLASLCTMSDPFRRAEVARRLGQKAVGLRPHDPRLLAAWTVQRFECAEFVRARLPCPTVAQLVAATARCRER